MTDAFAPTEAARPLWLTTLADLSLLLLGFFVLLQSMQAADRARLAAGLRAGFGIDTPAAAAPMTPAGSPMPVDYARVGGFAPASAIVPDTIATYAQWAATVGSDRRLTLTVTGSVDGSPRDVDPATGSAAILAADRARAVARALILSGQVAPAQLRVAIAPPSEHARAVHLAIGFAGNPAPAASTTAADPVGRALP